MELLLATVIVGDGSGLTNLNVAASGWSPTDAADGYYNSGLNFVGIGTSSPGYTLEVGDQAGTGVDLVVNTMSKFTGLTTVSGYQCHWYLNCSECKSYKRKCFCWYCNSN